MQNFVEELVAEYYQIKGCFVLKNYWIPYVKKISRTQKGKTQNVFEQISWTDIDVLVRNKKELILIQIKAVIAEKKTTVKIKQNFDIIEKYLTTGLALDGETPIEWWSKNMVIKKIVVYEYESSAPIYRTILKNQGIEVIPFKHYYEILSKYVEGKKGKKEQNPTMRFLHFLKDYKKRNQSVKKQ